MRAFAFILSAVGCVLALLFALSGGRSDGEISQIRVRNQTGMPIKQVEVNGIDYGDLPVGAVTGYRDMPSAYGYARVQLIMDGKRMRLQPDDYVGEQPLGRGHFTYVIVKQEGATMSLIDLQALRDP
ncbi:hypothetical protein [Massilia aerilata]|uniref:Uncharacterized protein n=1 Tax=Massilia aerilata TaxID=453817 RepID=A0ABW0RUW0_9BURK